MSLEKRVTKIECSLPPKQAALLWLEEMRRSGLSTFLARLSDPHENPLIRVPQMAARAVRERFNKNRIMPELANAEREAWRQAARLVVIAVGLNLTVLHGRRSRWTCKMLLREWLHGIMRGAPPDCVMANGWRMLLTDELREARLLREVTTVLSTTYYDGQSLLVTELQDDLEHHIQDLEAMAKPRKIHEPLSSCMAIDLMAVESSIKAQVPAVVANWVACARVEVLQLPGQPKGAYDLERCHPGGWEH